MTLADCIAKYETVQAQPLNARTSGLTPLGHATVAGRRFVSALRELDPEDRAETLATFAGELRGVIAELAPVVA